jgi:hypothetical protein
MIPVRYRVIERTEETADTVTLVLTPVDEPIAAPRHCPLWSAVHWDWVCEVLDARRAAALRHYTRSQLEVANRTLRRPVADLVLG